MATTGSFTARQVLSTPTVLGVVSRLMPNAQPFSRYYGCTMGRFTDRSPTDTAVYDIFNHTRGLANIRPGDLPANRVTPQKIGVFSASLMRVHENMFFSYEKIKNFRPQGSPFGTVDRLGAKWLTQQAKFLLERTVNLHEFAFTRMFQGGFSVIMQGNDCIPVELGATGSHLDIGFEFQAAHKDQLALLTGGANVITAPWNDPSADILGQLNILKTITPRISGWPVSEIWGNSLMYNNLLNNQGLQKIGGQAYRVFDTFTKQPLDSPEGAKNGVYTVKFRAAPEWNFHFTDHGWTPNVVGGESTAVGDWSKAIPDGKVVITPPPSPGDYYGLIGGHSIIQEQYTSGPREAWGFTTWRRNELKPTAGIDLFTLLKEVPCLINPFTIFCPTVVF